MRFAAYLEKFATYYRYFERGSYTEDYTGFPTILVVACDNATEERIARAARLAAIGRGVKLPLLITCEWRIERDPSNPDGLLGRIWREPGADFSTRRFWPLPDSRNTPRNSEVQGLRPSDGAVVVGRVDRSKPLPSTTLPPSELSRPQVGGRPR